MYTRWARPYDLAVKLLPVWRHWLSAALPHIRGPRVLEVSFGTGWLLTRCANNFDTCGVDLNARMVAVARHNLRRAGVTAQLRQANVEALPFADGQFDTVVNTMSFSGYPDAQRAMTQMHRVLRHQGRLVLIDVGYPDDGHRLGRTVAGLWKRAGDVIRDMPAIFDSFGFDVHHEQLGGFGSVHLYVATKQRPAGLET
ncbi:class I SAM-dependent methyltransferase [Mycobacterium servetii]|uniref:Class I SAM-dependent methyltransferase n=1 Tax=Mycobacterium servetii TaxID=3237418 RepID=A0ABV4C1C2_9MYCO